MARTIIYPRALTDASVEFEVRRSGESNGFTKQQPNKEGAPLAVEQRTSPDGNGSQAATARIPHDGYTDKLTKYVPAEVLSFFAPTVSLIGERPELVFAAAGVGLLATPGYLWRTAQNKPEKEKPLPHFYLLAAISFVVWAVATTRLGSLIGLDQTVTAFILAATVFVLPLLDDLLARAQLAHNPQLSTGK
jgi:hypothetical protein